MGFITLSNGMRMPQLGYGTLQIPDADCERCVRDALETGYRLIDTAASYQNEHGVGLALKNAALPRSEFFVTTKLWVQDAGYESAKRAVEASLNRLGLDHIDLYLVHHPFGDYYGAWRAMEELYRQGVLRAIGVCNFDDARLADLCLNSEIRPMVNQLELHPFHAQPSALATMQRYHVQPEAWGPLFEGQRNIFRNPVLAKIAQKYGRTVAQVALRWNIQRGVVVIPKAVQKEQMEENFRIWDFELAPEDLKKIGTLDLGRSEIINYTSACTAKNLNEWKIHENY